VGEGSFWTNTGVSFVPFLVGGIPTPLKNDGVRQWVSDDIPYMKWTIKVMFETTNLT